MEKEKEFSSEEDDDCYEIDPLDFTKKLSLEVSDDVDDNEVVLVAAKGPVALRDFPHPRHLCANLPFKSTPHEKHCKQCHCNVCEIPAPCSEWNTETGAHCHESGRSESRILARSPLHTRTELRILARSAIHAKKKK